jgi:hypothetical protein
MSRNRGERAQRGLPAGMILGEATLHRAEGATVAPHAGGHDGQQRQPRPGQDDGHGDHSGHPLWPWPASGHCPCPRDCPDVPTARDAPGDCPDHGHRPNAGHWPNRRLSRGRLNGHLTGQCLSVSIPGDVASVCLNVTAD